tara:strand:+ start:1174 stop:1629 length:456 start_codon:yes stop_codon:yes gene_type:complete
MALRKKKQLGGKSVVDPGTIKPKGKNSKLEALRDSGVRMPGDKGYPTKPSSIPKIKATHGNIFTKQKGGALNSSTYNKSNKGIQDNITKGGVNKRRGEMINADEELKDDRNNKKPRLTKVKKVKLKKKIVSKIPNIYQSGGFLEPGTESID